MLNEKSTERIKRSIPISVPNLGEDEWLALKEPLTTGWLTQGPKVKAFEEAFAMRHASKHALACTSCTTGLHLILEAMDLKTDDEIIVPSFTWVATANSVLYCGAKPVLVDIDPLTFNIDPRVVAKAVTPKTRAIIAVHLFGLCADIRALQEAAPGIPIIEDAACAAGGAYHGKPAGTLGLAAAFSFHPRKSVTTGEGGMITTQDDALSRRITMLRNHGASISEEERHRGSKPYLLPSFPVMGFNFRMTDLQGAIGVVQLSKLDHFISERQQWADFYSRSLADLPWLRTPTPPPGYSHAWQSYVCYVDETKAPISRNALMEVLYGKGVSTRPGTHAVHMLQFYQEKFGFTDDAFPRARDAARYSMAIPLHNRMSREDYEYIVNCLHEIGSN